MSEPLDLAGREVGRYLLLSLLGSGGMGAVYDAVDETLGRHVALKILPPELVSDPDRVRRFALEARSASALNHPHLIAIFDIGTHEIDGKLLHFIAMEKVDGTTLRDALAAGPLPIEGAIELMLQIVDAIAAAHTAGIVHRDLKPENIMVSGDGYAKVLDFGLAKLQEDETPATDPDAKTKVMPTPTGFILGTPGYMSPERAQGNRSDHRTDIFALGCILYEVVTGKRAFHGASAFDTLFRVVHSEPEPIASFVPDTPAELQRIVSKALAKDPDQRYQSSRELSADLRGLLRQMRSGDKPAEATTQPKWMWIAAVLVVVFVAIIAAVWAWRRPAARVEPVMRRITSSGDVVSASISPDGKYMAYIVYNNAGGSLWIRQLGTRQNLRLLPPSQLGFRGQAFTPDGTGIVYVLLNDENPAGTLFRISTLGGRPQRILEGIENAPSFSPDGRRMAWLRPNYPRRGQSALMVASSDGSDARPLATRQYPDLFAPIPFGGPSWSSDGSLIAVTVNRAQRPKEATLLGFSPEGGPPKPLSDAKWRSLGQAAWMPDMSGLVVIGTLQDDPLASADIALRLWFLPWPSGPPRRLTNDLLFFRNVTISADGRSLVTVGIDVSTQIWHVPLTTEGQAQKISTGRLDGWNGVSVAPDGQIVYSAVDDTQVNIVLANADGSDPVPLTREAGLNSAAFSGGVAYIAPGASGNEIRVTDFAGKTVRTVVRGVDADLLAATRDGQWLAYHMNRLLWKVRLDGSDNQQLTRLPTIFCSWSPAGDRLALLYDDAGQRRLGIMPATGGAITWSTPYIHRAGSTVRWTADGTALLVNDQPNDLANIWKVPFQGSPQKLTRLSEQDAFVFDVSPDGRNAVVARGRLSRDAILITGFR